MVLPVFMQARLFSIYPLVTGIKGLGQKQVDKQK